MGLRRATARYLTNTRLLGIRSSTRMLVDDWTIRVGARRPIARTLPRYMQVEVTTICNLHCTFCPRTTVMVPNKEKPVKHMKLADFKRIMDELPFLWKVQLQGYGEPLLNNDIIEMIRYARAKNVAVQMNTNLTRWPKAGVEALVRSGISSVIVSVDGATPKVFEAGRVGAKFDVVIGNLRQLVETRRRTGMRTPLVETATVVMPMNVHEMPELITLLREIGVDRSNFQLERSYKGDWVQSAREAFDQLGAAASGIHFDHGEGGYVDPDRVKPPCPWPWRAGYVTVDGFVTACCEYPATVAKHHNFGNLLETPFKDIWNGPRYRAFRRKLISGEAPKVCVGCPAAP